MTTLTPAYGRDYTTAAAVRADWLAGKDFIVADLSSRWDGKPANKDDLLVGRPVTLRYDRLRKTTQISE